MASYRNVPAAELERMKQLDFSTANRVTNYGNGCTFNDMHFAILGGVHSFLYSRSIFQLGTEKHHETLKKAINYD